MCCTLLKLIVKMRSIIICLFIATFVYTATALPPLPTASSCVPGFTYQDGSRTCRCIDSSPPRCLTKSRNTKRSTEETESIVQNAEENTFPPLPEDGSCVVGKSYQDGCNICSCFGEKALLCNRKPECVEKKRIVRDTAQTGKEEQKGEQQTCKEGDKMQIPLINCAICVCKKKSNGLNKWFCNESQCEDRRRKRGIGAIPDLKNTPCAPNDSFRLDCNTCYCNSAKTGYRCTEHICVPDNSSEILIAQNATETIPFNISLSISEDEAVSSSTTPVPLHVFDSTVVTGTTSSPWICNTSPDTTKPISNSTASLTSVTTPKTVINSTTGDSALSLG